MPQAGLVPVGGVLSPQRHWTVAGRAPGSPAEMGCGTGGQSRVLGGQRALPWALWP